MAGARFQLFSDVPHYTIHVEIEGAVYSLQLMWNNRNGAWYLRLLDESGQPVFIGERAVGPRRVVAVGPWLTVAEDDRLTVEQFRRLYDLTDCFFPGMLYAVSPRPLDGVREDADMIELEYVDAENLRAAAA